MAALPNPPAVNTCFVYTVGKFGRKLNRDELWEVLLIHGINVIPVQPTRKPRRRVRASSRWWVVWGLTPIEEGYQRVGSLDLQVNRILPPRIRAAGA